MEQAEMGPNNRGRDWLYNLLVPFVLAHPKSMTLPSQDVILHCCGHTFVISCFHKGGGQVMLKYSLPH